MCARSQKARQYVSAVAESSSVYAHGCRLISART